MKWHVINGVDDIDRLVEFDRKVYPKKDRMTREEYLEWFQKGLIVHVLVNRRDQWIGTYQVLIHTATEFYFAGFGVIPSHRRKRFGQALMTNMINIYGHRDLTCKTRGSNRKMKSLLTKNGFANKLDDITEGEHWTWWTKKAH